MTSAVDRLAVVCGPGRGAHMRPFFGSVSLSHSSRSRDVKKGKSAISSLLVGKVAELIFTCRISRRDLLNPLTKLYRKLLLVLPKLSQKGGVCGVLGHDHAGRALLCLYDKAGAAANRIGHVIGAVRHGSPFDDLLHLADLATQGTDTGSLKPLPFADHPLFVE